MEKLIQVDVVPGCGLFMGGTIVLNYDSDHKETQGPLIAAVAKKC